MGNLSNFIGSGGSGGGGGGGPLVNGFQTGSIPIGFNQLLAYSVASPNNQTWAIGNVNIAELNVEDAGPNNTRLDYPASTFNTYTTIENVTSANGGAFCYAGFLHRNGITSNNNMSGGDVSFRITLDGVEHIVNYRPTNALQAARISICSLGFPTGARFGRANTQDSYNFNFAGLPVSPIGLNTYGTYWNAGTGSSTQTSFGRPNFTPQNTGTTNDYEITTPVAGAAFEYDLDADGFAQILSGSGGFQGAGSTDRTGVVEDTRNMTIFSASATTGGNIRLTIRGAATVNSDGTLTIPMRSTRLAGDNNALSARIDFITTPTFTQQTLRSTRYDSFYASPDVSASTNFNDPVIHVTNGLPWVQFDSTCHVEMSHTQDAEETGLRMEGNSGIYAF